MQPVVPYYAKPRLAAADPKPDLARFTALVVATTLMLIIIINIIVFDVWVLAIAHALSNTQTP